MALDYIDPFSTWGTGGRDFSSSEIFTPAPAGDTAAPNDSLFANLSRGLASIGEKTAEGFSKTADLFGNALGGIAQAKTAWETIFRPKNQRPDSPVENSQLPSLQPKTDTTAQLSNWTRLVNVLRGIKVSPQTDNVRIPTSSQPAFSLLLPAGLAALIIVLALRRK